MVSSQLVSFLNKSNGLFPRERLTGYLAKTLLRQYMMGGSNVHAEKSLLRHDRL
jgi:hypothetical protein